MKISGYSVCVLAIMAMLLISGCVAPPKESPLEETTPNTQKAGIPATTSAPGSAAQVTHYVTLINPEVSRTQTPGYHIFTTPTPFPEEKSCRIYTTTQTFLYNGSAFTFDLKNPPMYINYSVVPTNVTERGVATSRYKTKAEIETNVSTYDPQSYLVITVRSKATGEIYLQDGFGKDYTQYLKRTLKVLNQDDMLVELKGNKIKGTISFWVKPYGNFDDADNMTFDACTYWAGSIRDNTALALINATPTVTWTPKK